MVFPMIALLSVFTFKHDMLKAGKLPGLKVLGMLFLF
jgi:hypothetical protein